MDQLLIATFIQEAWGWAVLILEVALALGAVIFVHELGHFAVAKMCGVKCEKFYIGFDAYGLKLFHFRWGETEYGIGVIPFGGYVKMLGQEDNPAKAAEEIERAKLQSADGTQAPGDSVQPVAYDPRSYLAKSVPQRMAIISAGVVMNIIFAFVLAMIAFSRGVMYTPCIVSGVVGGESAWQADVRPGDDILSINGNPTPRFQDLQTNIVLGRIKNGVTLRIKRPGVSEPISMVVHPARVGGADTPTIGVMPPRMTKLADELPALPWLPAAKAEPPLEKEDEIIAVNGESIHAYADLLHHQALSPEKPLHLTVRRQPLGDESGDEKAKPAPAKEVEVVVQPRPVWSIGVVMNMGKITAVQKDSPAAQAGIQAGDFIIRIDGEPPGDPMLLPERLRRRAGQTITVTVSREGHNDPIDFKATLRTPDFYTSVLFEGQSLTAPALGIAYCVLNHVQGVEPDSPAAGKGIAAGDAVISARLIPPEKPEDTPSMISSFYGEKTIEFTDEKQNWPFLWSEIQESPPGTKVVLTLRDKRNGDVELAPLESKDWFYPSRGFVCAPVIRVQRSKSLSENIVMAKNSLFDSVSQVYLVIHKIFTKQVSPKVLGGPAKIAAFAGAYASQGLPELFMFLSLLSANLAVINFLPIPLLDGGHIVFLLWEGIRGKPASEQVVLAFHYAGFCLIIGLMMWVIFLDATWVSGLFSR